MSSVSFAYYRLPYADTYTVVESDHAPAELYGFDEIGNAPGFVIVPAACGFQNPALLISADSITTRKLRTLDEIPVQTSLQEPSEPDERYTRAFNAFHEAVKYCKFSKLVLARNKRISLDPTMAQNPDESMRSLFEKACRMYPRLMIMLYSTPQSGTWLIASPEILVDGSERKLHTVALAGTMPFREGHIDWSDKNKHEQLIVEQYIENVLLDLSSDLVKDGPVTSRAGNLVHLRTDFRFRLLPDVALGRLLRQLHPTPAICGMPKNEAAAFISEHEGLDRRYYSGFAGPVNLRSQTHLYVSLRCAELFINEEDTSAVLYAGGGIMHDSECLSEWNETESKMKTIGYVLQ